MLDGIDYYPKKPKRGKRTKVWWLLLLIVAIFSTYYYLNEHQILNEKKSTVIVLSEPETEEIIISAPLNTSTQDLPTYKAPDILENLDEVIESYQQ